MNAISSVIGLALPHLTLTMVGEDNTNMSGWKNVFLMLAVFTGVFGFLFLFFGSVQRQNWSRPDKSKSVSDQETGVDVIT